MARSENDVLEVGLMGELDKLLDDLAQSGDIASADSSFTINAVTARETLAKFSLENPTEFILKFVQAANLSADSFKVDRRKSELYVLLGGWDPTLTLDRVLGQFTNSSLSIKDDALGYLFLGLITLTEKFPNDVRLRQRIEGESVTRHLVIDQKMEVTRTKENSCNDESSLEISWPKSAGYDLVAFGVLLDRCCGFSPIPITYKASPLEVDFPKLSDQTAREFFPEHQTIGWYQAPSDYPLPNLKTDSLVPAPINISTNEPFVSLRLTTSSDPMATILFMKAGVVLEEKCIDLGFPGLIGAVAADHLATDLSGQRFRQGQGIDRVIERLCAVSKTLVNHSLANPYKLKPNYVCKLLTEGAATGIACLVLLVGMLVLVMSMEMANLMKLGYPQRELTIWGGPFLASVASLTLVYRARIPMVERETEKAHNQIVVELLEQLRH